MPTAEQAKKVIAEISDSNVDELVRTNTLSSDLEEVSLTSCLLVLEITNQIMVQSIRGHIHQELTSWLFFRKLAADCSRATIALHGFA